MAKADGAELIIRKWYEIVAAVMQAKGAAQDDKAFKALVTERVLSILGKLAKRGDIVKTGTSPNTKWATAPELL